MSKKIISLFTILAFIIFSLSCTTTKNVRLDADDAQKVKKGEILSVNKTSGEYIEFSKKTPGKVYKDTIRGIAERVTKEIEIDRVNVESAEKDEKGKFVLITTKDGKMYQDFVGAVKEEKDKYIFTAVLESSKLVSIPFSEVKLVRIKELKPFSTALAVIGVIGAAFFLLMGIGLATQPQD